MQAVKPYFQSLRVLGWIPAYFALTMGFLDGRLSSLPNMITTAIVTGFIIGPGFIVNYISDVELDRKSHVKRAFLKEQQPFLTGKLTPRAGHMFALLLTVIGLALALTVNLSVMLLACYGTVIGYIYSIGPRLKAKPFFDVAANASTFGVTSYITGFATCRTLTTVSMYPLIWIGLLAASAYIAIEMIDAPDDYFAGLKTTTTVLGMKTSLKLAAVLFGASVVFYLIGLVTYASSLSYLMMLPFLIGMAATFIVVRRHKTIAKAYIVGTRTSVFVCGVATLVLFATYLSLGVAGVDQAILQATFRVLISIVVMIATGWILWRFRKIAVLMPSEWLPLEKVLTQVRAPK